MIDKNHPQVVNQEITLIPKSSGKYEVVLPEEFSVNNLYDYNAEEIKRTSNFKRVPNKIIGINEWYETPFLKFKLVKKIINLLK